MRNIDFSGWTVDDLLKMEAALRAEFKRRGITQTDSDLGGEFGEYLALRVYGGHLTAPGNKSFDLVDGQKRRIQIKTRTLPRDTQRIFAFADLDFDLAVCLRFERKTNALQWAREFDVSEVESLVTRHATGFRLGTLQAFENGRDVTAKFQQALEAASVVEADIPG